LYRYEVVETWGDVPDFVSRLVGEADAFLLYSEDRGEWSQQSYWRDADGIVGGWALERRGAAYFLNGHAIQEIPEADLSDERAEGTSSDGEAQAAEGLDASCVRYGNNRSCRAERPSVSRPTGLTSPTVQNSGKYTVRFTTTAPSTRNRGGSVSAPDSPLGVVTSEGTVRPPGSALTTDEMADIERILLLTLDADDAMTVVQELMAAGYSILSEAAIERTMRDIADGDGRRNPDDGRDGRPAREHLALHPLAIRHEATDHPREGHLCRRRRRLVNSPEW
jgi:hypothetical protein